jgi:UDP-N-acetylmuramoyl-tripeptide--D-alanyl-D-alanine ligase
MSLLGMVMIALVWGGGTAWRIYKQARFYQIEEYQSGRYVRWLGRERERFLPTRPLASVAFAILFSLFTDSVPTGFSVVPYIVAMLASLVAIIPPKEAEIKKKFVRTQRATRIIATAWGILAVYLLIALLIINRIGIDSDRVKAIAILIIGLVAFLGAPLLLMLGNVLMTPVESFLRQRFIARAKQTLHAVNPKIIGITGSYGKTTTKNFLRDILNGRYKTYATPKSYNTMMGVCIAINNDLANDYSVEYFVSEMGAYITGEIQRICELTPPDISIVIEVGPQHLERFGSLENIATAKYEIIKNLRPDGLGVFNWDNPYVREMYDKGYPNNRIAVSRVVKPSDVTNAVPRFVASDITETLNGLSFAVIDTLNGTSEWFTTSVMGAHNVTNILLATAVAVHEGMSLKDVAQRVRALQPAESRLVRQSNDKGVMIINDAYSANPVGVVSSLQVLGMHQQGRRVLITPGMVELGEMHVSENFKLGVLATQYATDIILVGEKQTQPIQDGIRSTAFPPDRLHIVAHVSEAIHWYQTNLQKGDAVLLLNDLPDTY